jgi:hypothetical protein
MTLKRERNLVHANFPFNTSTDILSMTTLQDSFTFGTSTCAFPKRTLHREGNIMHANSPSIVSKRTRKIHFQQLCYIVKICTSALQKTIILHHGQKITHVSFHYSNNISEIPKTTLQQHK